MADNFFHKTKKLIREEFYDSDQNSIVASLAAFPTYTYGFSSDSTFYTWLLTYLWQSEANNRLLFQLCAHVPTLIINDEFSHSSREDITSYEVQMMYDSSFVGDVTIDIQNVDLSNIEIIEIFTLPEGEEYVSYDLTSSGAKYYGILYKSSIADVTSSLLQEFDDTANNPALFLFGLDGSNDASDMTAYQNYYDYDLSADVNVTAMGDAENYRLALFANNADFEETDEAILRITLFTMDATLVSFSNKAELSEYTIPLEKSHTASYQRDCTFDSTDDLLSIDSEGSIAYITISEILKMGMFIPKDVTFHNNGTSDVTFQFRSENGGDITVLYDITSNDFTHTIDPNDCLYNPVIRVFHAPFELDESYNFDFTVTISTYLNTDYIDPQNGQNDMLYFFDI